MRVARRRKPPRQSRGNRVTLFTEGKPTFDAMLAAIDAADRQVLLEMYWFASDEVGRRFAESLSRASERGVEVAVIYDAVGSVEADSSMFDEMSQRGVRVHEFHPIKPWSGHFALTRVRRRDHRKILVVDGVVGFAGGLNLAVAWLDHAEAAGFRDDTVRIEGPGTAQLSRLFHETWAAVEPRSLGVLPVPLVREDSGALVEILGQGDLRGRLAIARAYAQRIGQARNHVFISNAYFVPPGRILRSLVHAAKRGVDVRVLMPKTPDVPAVRLASQSLWDGLLRAGVKLYEYERRVLHSKSATIDDEWSTVGTFNFDSLSFHFNREVNVVVSDAEFARLMRRQFERDLSTSREVTPDGLASRDWREKALSCVLSPFRSLL